MSDPTHIAPGIAAALHTLAANIDRAERRGVALDPQHISPAEHKLMEAFARIGLEPVQQHPIGAYDADFYFPDVSIVIEVDGQQHDTDERWQRDRRRDLALSNIGIRTYRIPALDVFRDADACAQQVRDLIDKTLIRQMETE